MFRTMRWAGLAAILAAGQAWGQSDPAGSDGYDWSAADREAAAFVLEKAASGETVTLDHSDPRAARFLKRQYERAGLTEARYPGLHGLIESHQRIHAEQGVTYPETVQVSDDLVYTDIATQMLALFPTSTPSNFQGSAAASVEAAEDDPARTLQISYTSLCFYDLNNNPIGDCATSSSFGSGQYFPVNHAVTTADQAFTGAFSATYYDTTNKRYVSQISALTLDTIDYPASQTISDPVIVHDQNDSLETALVCTSRSVNANANPGTCDYGTYSNTDVLVDMEGSVAYKPEQTPRTDGSGDLVGTGSVSLINTVQGGNCRLAPSISGSNFFSQDQVAYNGTTKTLSWNFDDLDFGETGSLICGGDGTDIQFALTLQVENEADADNTIVASQLSQPGVVTPHFLGPTAGSLATPMLRLVAGCLHPDTLIQMADGSAARPISEFLGEGERVVSIGGVETHVIGTTEGEETRLFVIESEAGLSVQASAMHPFIMADGSWRAAEDLSPGDRVLASDGAVTLSSVTETAYDGPVYNLMLARTTDVLNPETGAFYANGFLVGGHDAQQKLAAARLAAPARVEGLLPEAFATDYASHREDRARR